MKNVFKKFILNDSDLIKILLSLLKKREKDWGFLRV